MPAPLRALARVTTGVTVAVLVVGTWVTGSGPHAGDHGAARNGLDPETISQVHADGVFLLIGLSVALIFAFRAVGAQRATRAAIILVAVELGQGLIGFVQYFTHVPAILVGAHMLGSCLVLLAALSVQWSTRERRPVTPAPQATPTDAADPGTSHRLTARGAAPRAPRPAVRALPRRASGCCAFRKERPDDARAVRPGPAPRAPSQDPRNFGEVLFPDALRHQLHRCCAILAATRWHGSAGARRRGWPSGGCLLWAVRRCGPGGWRSRRRGGRGRRPRTR